MYLHEYGYNPGDPQHFPSRQLRSSRALISIYQVAEGMNTNILIPDVFLGDTLDLVDGDSVNSHLNLLGRHSASSSDELTTNIFSDSCCAVEAKEETGLELALCPLNFGLGSADCHTSPLLDDEVGKIVQVNYILGNTVDTPETGI